MIKRIKRYFKNLSLIIENVTVSNSIIKAKFEFSRDIGKNPGQIFRENLYKDGITSAESDNPSFLHQYYPSLNLPHIDNATKTAMGHAVIQACLDGDVGANNIIAQIFLSAYAGMRGHLPMLFVPENGQADTREVFIRLDHGTWRDFASPLKNAFGQLGLPIVLEGIPVNATRLRERLMERHARAAAFYLAVPEWTQQFYDNLGDDLSRSAFFSFIKQRIYGSIFWNTDVAYSLVPTPETGYLRKEALARTKSWPYLYTSDVVGTLPFLDVHTFIFEQYRIPGVAEVKPGQTVVDVGATYGDTAIYFSRHMRNEGRVIAVEPLDENLTHLRRNIALHNSKNIEIVPCALGKQDGYCSGNMDGTPSTVFRFGESTEDNTKNIRLTTLDKLAGTTRIDFVKADIEGAELEMIEGARQVISRDKPVFALALYHKQNDFRQLPRALSKYNPGYTYYVRIDAEPMLFAVPK